MEEEILAGHYQIVKELGGGAFGKTFLAQDNHLPGKDLCVVKQLKPRVRDETTLQIAKRLFDGEAKTLYKLGSHPQIPHLLAHFEQDEEFYLVQELIEGQPLNQEIIPGKQLSEVYVKALLQDILSILAFVHQHNVIHRDIKPANLIRRSKDGKIVLIDFGALKEVSTTVVDAKGSVRTIAIGTHGYMPVEQLQGLPKFSSDVYAVGMMAIQALTGIVPIDLPQDNDGEVIWRDRTQISDTLAEILTKMVQSNFRQRYSNASEVLRDLNQTEELESISGFWGLIFLQAVIGLICNRSDTGLKQACQTGIQEFINSLKEASQSVNQELQKAITRSFLKAQHRIATEYRHEVGGLFPTLGQFSPFRSPQQRDALRWVNQKIPQLNQEIRRVNQQSVQMEIDLLDGINSMLNSLRSPEEIAKKRNNLHKAVLKGDEPPGYVEKLRRDRGGLFNLACAYFADEIKIHQQLRDIFSSLLLKPINAQFEAGLTIEDLTDSLLNSTLDLEGLTSKFELPIELDKKERTETPLPPDSGEYPEGPVGLDSPFYIQRPDADYLCYQTIVQPGALIRIKAPKQMGKTSLLNRIIAHAARHNYATVYLDLGGVERGILSNLDKFLRWLCFTVGKQQKIENKLNDYWDTDILGSNDNCTAYFEEYLLPQINRPLVLGLDRVDRVFRYAEVIEDFFGMLRSWHEKGKTAQIWQQMRLVMAHSTEAYIPLDMHQSPFNAGVAVELLEFEPEQLLHLAKVYELNWNKTQIEQLENMVGGHPYLVRLAMYKVSSGKVTLEKLLKDAPTEAGIYNKHLMQHLEPLRQAPQLAQALKQVVSSPTPVEIDPMDIYQLHSMGLVQCQENYVKPRCQLYRQYFSRVL
ncbi:MAG: AAA-like domain-containing protein [Xenococcaceae cyanobacterium]